MTENQQKYSCQFDSASYLLKVDGDIKPILIDLMFMKHERAKRANVLLILKCRLQNRRYVRPKNQLVSLYVLQIIAVHLLPKCPKFEGTVPNVRDQS